MMTGAEILIDALKKEGVDIVFGYPGGVVLPVFDVLFKTPEIRVVLTRHEQAAVHAADGYARATGRTGVCLVTSGPGATNTITGLANAKLDSIPIVVISGQVKTAVIGTDAFQEADMAGLTRPICKHSYLVQRVEDLPQVLKNSFYIARSGRPGPVAVDLPADVAQAPLENYAYPEHPDIPSYQPPEKGNANQIRKLAAAVKQASRPVILAGGGIVAAGASAELVRFAEKTNIPVATTLMALGCVPDDHELFLGMPGMHGRVSANYALMECDLLIGMGTRFDDRVTGDLKSFAAGATIAHVDIDPSEIGKILRTQIPIVGDVRSVLADLDKAVAPRPANEWNRIVREWSLVHPLSYVQDPEGEILPQYVIDRVNLQASKDTIIATDVGQHQMWSALFVRHRGPRAFLSSGGMGTMGFGLPAAMGASLGFPDRPVVVITGDGSIQMNIQELPTCTLNRIPVKIVVLNNSCLGMVRQWQELFYDGHYSKTCLKERPECRSVCSGHRPDCPNAFWPDFVRVAEANGMPGFRATRVSEVDEVLCKGFAVDGPALMEFRVKKIENVYPMVPGGKPINVILLGAAR
ncbi:MAG: biosynthetic-type acetolactate synthase large subunit [Candidatus Aminicenantes bacterium]|nr:biosynthetic-type acetolactate synthase large subunit [Candidatus Aminicenantes bacterium]